MKNTTFSFRALLSGEVLHTKVKPVLYKVIMIYAFCFYFISAAYPTVVVGYSPFSWIPFLLDFREALLRLIVFIAVSGFLRNVLFSFLFELFKYLRWGDMYYETKNGESKSAKNFILLVKLLSNYTSTGIVSVLAACFYIVSFLKMNIVYASAYQLGLICFVVLLASTAWIAKIKKKFKYLGT